MMCDTLVATSEATIDRVTVFAKNSDREPNEAQQLVFVPAQDFPPGSSVQCTYLQIPQAEHTNAILLSKPFWMWGAEMGFNEHGVAIGNEAVFTKVPYVKGDALTGMDLLRLGLERGSTAHEALMVMLELLEEFGQGGNCGYQHKLYYHNSFLIADPHETWVLETAGPHWAAKKVKGVYSISNGLTIDNDYDMASPHLVSYAVQKGWCKGKQDFDFSRCYSDFIYTYFSDCRSRRKRSMDLLNSSMGEITADTAMRILRDHGSDAGASWTPDKGITGANVCMHAGFGPVRASQTVGSMVVHLHPEHPTCFFTATAAPCTSVFKPVWLDAGLPDLGIEPKGTFDDRTLFWRHEMLHRTTLCDYANRIKIYEPDRRVLEKQFVSTAIDLADHPAAERLEYSIQCFKDVDSAESRWLDKVDQAPIINHPGPLYTIVWNGFNRQAEMPIPKM